MGTEKRERQKANRHQRLVEEHKAARTSAIKRNVMRWVIIAVLAVGAVVLIAWIGGAFSGDDEPDASIPPATVPTTVPTDPTTTIAFETPDKPEVELPEELPTELQVTTLVAGEGPEAAVGDTVTVHYVGVRSEDGTEFDNSYDRGAPYPVVLGVGSVIDGWEQGLVGAQVGERRQLDIPADLAYGDNPQGDIIQPGDALTFVIDVMAVTPADGT